MPSKKRKTQIISATSHPAGRTEAARPGFGYKAQIGLVLILACFLAVECFLPMKTAVQIGADEGFELAKATLCLNGYKLYSEVWNDQPPLHTWLVRTLLTWSSGGHQRTQAEQNFTFQPPTSRQSDGNSKLEQESPKDASKRNENVTFTARNRIQNQILNVGNSPLAPRVLTIAFAGLLLSSIFGLVFRLSGLAAAILTTAMLILSPGFIELSSSCMLEIPALACALAALWILAWQSGPTSYFSAGVAGLVYAAALLMKLVPVYLLPVVAYLLWIRSLGHEKPAKAFLLWPALFAGSLILGFVLIDLTIESGAFLVYFGQTWSSHFGKAVSSEYGSAQQHPFAWSILAKNWDTTIPAVAGVAISVFKLTRWMTKYKGSATVNENPPSNDYAGIAPNPVPEPMKRLIPLLWLLLAFLVFGLHKPWWPYYYIHTAIPLCWCAALGIEWLFASAIHSRNRGVLAFLMLFALCATAWASGRLYLQVTGIRALPKTYETLAIDRIKRLGGTAKLMYADEPIYSFHTGVPLVPQLAVLPLKRFWMGDLTNDRVTAELEKAKPDVILLTNNGALRPFDELLGTGYRLTYMDPQNRLYVRRSVPNQRASTQ